jgi:putative transposase
MLVGVTTLLKMVHDWQGFLASGVSDEEDKILLKHERTGRPLGNTKFMARLEAKLGKALMPQKGGRPKKKN